MGNIIKWYNKTKINFLLNQKTIEEYSTLESGLQINNDIIFTREKSIHDIKKKHPHQQRYLS